MTSDSARSLGSAAAPREPRHVPRGLPARRCCAGPVMLRQPDEKTMGTAANLSALAVILLLAIGAVSKAPAVPHALAVARNLAGTLSHMVGALPRWELPRDVPR